MFFFFTLKEHEIFLNCFQSDNGEATEIPLEIVHTPDISDRCLRVRNFNFLFCIVKKFKAKRTLSEIK